MLTIRGFLPWSLGLAFAVGAGAGGCRRHAAEDAPATAGERSIAVAGVKRTYRVHLPPAYETTREPLPVVIVLHGGGGNAKNAEETSGMSPVADTHGFVAVYPNGTGPGGDKLLTWNSGNCCGAALTEHVDDVAFLSALIGDVEHAYHTDPKRVFITGISNGGMMAYRAACELADRVAAIAPVAGALGVETCRPSQPVSVIAFHGTDDEHVPYDGGKGKKSIDPHPRFDKPVSYAIEFWTKHDGCEPMAVRQQKGPVERQAYSACRDGTAVELHTIEGGGHAWPGGRKGSPGGDEPTQVISASDLMLKFFLAHPRH